MRCLQGSFFFFVRHSSHQMCFKLKKPEYLLSEQLSGSSILKHQRVFGLLSADVDYAFRHPPAPPHQSHPSLQEGIEPTTEEMQIAQREMLWPYQEPWATTPSLFYSLNYRCASCWPQLAFTEMISVWVFIAHQRYEHLMDLFKKRHKTLNMFACYQLEHIVCHIILT